MEQPIVIRFRWTADELVRAYGYHFRHTCRPVFRFALHGIFGLMLVAGALGISKGSGVSIPISIAFLAGGVYWFVLRRFERRWMVRRQFRKRPDRDVELEWQIGPDEIRTQSSLGKSEVRWQTFAKMVRTPTGMMFYPTEQMFHWLPRSGFASDADFETCVELAKSKIEKHYEVS